MWTECLKCSFSAIASTFNVSFFGIFEKGFIYISFPGGPACGVKLGSFDYRSFSHYSTYQWGTTPPPHKKLLKVGAFCFDSTCNSTCIICIQFSLYALTCTYFLWTCCYVYKNKQEQPCLFVVYIGFVSKNHFFVSNLVPWYFSDQSPVNLLK
jgi:hypothetical protein